MATDWVSAIERDGFAIRPRVIGPDTVATLSSAIAAVPPGAALDRGGGAYAMRDLLRAMPEARRLALSPPLMAIAGAVLGAGAFVVRGLLFDKTRESNWLVPWHQDLTIAVRERRDADGYGPWTVKAGIPHVRPPTTVLERMLTLRVHLDDDDPSKGPLRIVPGSHRGGRLGAIETRRWLERAEPTSCLVPAGGVLAMRPLILHASSSASGAGRRRVVHLEYAADPLPGGIDWFESETLTVEIHEDAWHRQ